MISCKVECHVENRRLELYNRKRFLNVLFLLKLKHLTNKNARTSKKSKCNCCEILLLRYNKLRRVYEFIKKVGEIKKL